MVGATDTKPYLGGLVSSGPQSGGFVGWFRADASAEWRKVVGTPRGETDCRRLLSAFGWPLRGEVAVMPTGKHPDER